MASALLATEAQDQAALIEFCARLEGRIPALALLLHIPNGERRDKATAARLRRLGVRAGVPDLLLPVARAPWHGLWVELKRERGGRVEATQQAWHERLRAEGYAVRVCRGWRAAARELLCYLGASPEEYGL